jgi:hypothetical protein
MNNSENSGDYQWKLGISNIPSQSVRQYFRDRINEGGMTPPSIAPHDRPSSPKNTLAFAAKGVEPPGVSMAM